VAVTTLNSLPPDDQNPPRRQPVLAAIALVLLLIVSILGLLLYRSVRLPEPDRVLVVHSNSDWNGIELSIEGGPLATPQVTWIEKLGNYTVPFFLWPGKYTLHVRSQGTEILQRDFDLTNTRIEEFDLALSGATTRPATQPATTSAT
jgi:hypothetical protein